MSCSFRETSRLEPVELNPAPASGAEIATHQEGKKPPREVIKRHSRRGEITLMRFPPGYTVFNTSIQLQISLAACTGQPILVSQQSAHRVLLATDLTRERIASALDAVGLHLPGEDQFAVFDARGHQPPRMPEFEEHPLCLLESTVWKMKPDIVVLLPAWRFLPEKLSLQSMDDAMMALSRWAHDHDVALWLADVDGTVKSLRKRDFLAAGTTWDLNVQTRYIGEDPGVELSVVVTSSASLPDPVSLRYFTDRPLENADSPHHWEQTA